MLDFLWNCDRAMRLRECPPKMHSRRVPLRKHMEEPFDKCTSEYYSCARKGVHGRKFVVYKFAPPSSSVSMYIANDHDRADGCGRSSTLLDTDGFDLSCPDPNGKLQHVSPCESPYWSQEEGLPYQSTDHSKVNGYSNQRPAKGKQAKLNTCCSGCSDSSPLSTSSVDESDCLSVGLSSENEPDEKEMKCEVNMPSLSISPARAGHRRTFPPPLSSVATQSYCDKLGQSPGACSAGSCLRSFRCNGRFVLQEVKAPIQKYFRVLRHDGRLKLELFNAENDTSAEEDEPMALESCVGVDNFGFVGEMVTESACSTSKVCAEDACVGSTQSSLLYAESKCVASSSPLEKLMSVDSRAEISTEGCENLIDLVDKPAVVTEKGKPLICAVPEALSMQGTMSTASESPLSPRCIEIMACYGGPSPRLKSSWIRPISAC